jgi:hypothetical protein
LLEAREHIIYEDRAFHHVIVIVGSGERNGAGAVEEGSNGLDSSLDQEYSKRGRDALMFFAARRVF